MLKIFKNILYILIEYGLGAYVRFFLVSLFLKIGSLCASGWFGMHYVSINKSEYIPK